MAEVRRDMPQVLLHDCYVWLPYNLVAFRTIPTHIRPTTTALMTLGWNTYLSAVAVRARAGGTPAVAAPAAMSSNLSVESSILLRGLRSGSAASACARGSTRGATAGWICGLTAKDARKHSTEVVQ